jgi:hypothetical protein
MFQKDPAASGARRLTVQLLRSLQARSCEYRTSRLIDVPRGQLLSAATLAGDLYQSKHLGGDARS